MTSTMTHRRWIAGAVLCTLASLASAQNVDCTLPTDPNFPFDLRLEDYLDDVPVGTPLTEPLVRGCAPDSPTPDLRYAISSSTGTLKTVSQAPGFVSLAPSKPTGTVVVGDITLPANGMSLLIHALSPRGQSVRGKLTVRLYNAAGALMDTDTLTSVPGGTFYGAILGKTSAPVGRIEVTSEPGRNGAHLLTPAVDYVRIWNDPSF